MAHHLPRKKYLSKLLGDSPEDKYRATSTPSVIDSETLSANESSESLLTVIANSTKLGISSEFGSAVFTADSDRKCSDADETKDQTKCREVRSHSGPHVADDDEKVCEVGERESSPVYFDDGSMDDDENASDVKSGIGSVEDATNAGVVSVCSRLQTNQINDSDMMRQSSLTSCSSSGCLAIPASASMSSLIDDDVLSSLLPSAESFANLLNSLETRDRKHMSVSAGSSSVNHEQLDISMQQQQQQAQAHLVVPSFAVQTDGTSSLRHSCHGTSPLSVPVETVCVKEEQIDSSYEQKVGEPATTTSGRNRGRGKATEPKFDCQICGDVAAGYHCGAYVCEACKVLAATLRYLVFCRRYHSGFSDSFGIILVTVLTQYSVCSVEILPAMSEDGRQSSVPVSKEQQL